MFMFICILIFFILYKIKKFSGERFCSGNEFLTVVSWGKYFIETLAYVNSTTATIVCEKVDEKINLVIY